MKVERQFFLKFLNRIRLILTLIKDIDPIILATRLEYVEWHLGMCPKWSTICRKEGRIKL